jgi:hypothetical protein
MPGYSKGSLGSNISFHYNGKVEACVQGYIKTVWALHNGPI